MQLEVLLMGVEVRPLQANDSYESVITGITASRAESRQWKRLPSQGNKSSRAVRLTEHYLSSPWHCISRRSPPWKNSAIPPSWLLLLLMPPDIEAFTY